MYESVRIAVSTLGYFTIKWLELPSFSHWKFPCQGKWNHSPDQGRLSYGETFTTICLRSLVAEFHSENPIKPQSI